MFALAVSNHKLGTIAEAEALYRRILKADPCHAGSLHRLGLIAYEAGQHEQAIALMSQAIAGNDQVSAFHSNLGAAYQAAGRADDAAASPAFAPIGSAEAVALGFVLPFALWMTLFGATVFVHHTHPDIPWYETATTDRHLPVETVTTRWLFPTWFTFLSHNVFDHTIHHWNARIPCYNATKASEHLSELLGDRLICERFSMRALNDVLRRCKLYDYENRRWLDFDGNPTSESFDTERVIVNEGQSISSIRVA